MSEIKEQLLAETCGLVLSTKQITDHIYRKAALKRFLSSKEIVHVSNDKKEDIFQWNPSILFKDYADFYANLATGTVADADYSELTDGHNVSELFGGSKRWRVTPDYLKYIKSSTDGFIINVYGGEDTLISTNIWNLTNCQEGRAKFANGNIPPYEFATPDDVSYTFFGKATYWDDMFISTCRNLIAALAIDLPHTYYSGQILKGNVFTWDIVNEKYQVGNMNIDKINQRIGKIAYSGFDKPLVMRIDEGCLTPVDDETAVDLFLATYLNLPTIPAILYMSDEDITKNTVLEELHDITHGDFWHNAQALDVINNICKPYFFFEVAAESPSNPHLKAGGTFMNKNQYPSMNDINDSSLTVFNRYLDKAAKVEDVIFPMTNDDIEAMKHAQAEKLQNDIQEKVRLENIATNERILAGDY